jgi:hypothetical protein
MGATGSPTSPCPEAATPLSLKRLSPSSSGEAIQAPTGGENETDGPAALTLDASEGRRAIGW